VTAGFLHPLTSRSWSFDPGARGWTASAHEATTVDESLTFVSGGVNINADIGLSFTSTHRSLPIPTCAFGNRHADGGDGYVRNSVREAFNVVLPACVQDIYGAGKAKVVADVSGQDSTTSRQGTASSRPS